MGTEHRLIKIDKGETFDLGKGLWDLFYHTPHLKESGFTSQEPFVLRSVMKSSQLFDALMVCTEDWDWGVEKIKSQMVYCNQLQNKLWKWAGYARLVMWSDSETDRDIMEFHARVWGITLNDALFIKLSERGDDYRPWFRETGTRYFEPK